MRAPRWLRVLLTLLLGAVLVGAGSAPAFADTEPDGTSVVALDAAGAGVDDFEFASFDALYDLSRADDGRSQLRTVETFVAVFPDFDQNRGIRRALVTDYKGHSTSLDMVSVTDENGVPRDYEVATDDEGFTTVTIAVPEGQFVYGEQTYVIEYTQTDVTATSTDLTDNVTRDEFFWDTNGTGWRQPFGEVNATLRVSSEIRSALTGEAYCYYGYEGSTDQCQITSVGDGEFEASVSDLFGGQNMTIVVSFDEGTFAGAPFWTYIPILALLAIALTIFGLIFALVTRFVFWRDAPGRGTIIAQYEGPEGLGMFVAANIAGKKTKGMAASIVDLAVQKNLRILEHDQGWSKVFGVQKLSSAGLAPDEQRVMGALFSVNPFSMGGVLPGLRNIFSVGGSTPTPLPDPEGEVRWLTKGDTVLGQQVVALTKAVDKEVEAGGLRRKPSWKPMLITLGAFILAGILLIAQTIFGGGGERNVIITVVGLNILPWVAIFALAALGPPPAAHHEGLRTARAPRGAARVHPGRRGRPPADAAERLGSGAGHDLRRGGDRQDLREAPPVRRDLRAREGSGRPRSRSTTTPPSRRTGTRARTASRSVRSRPASVPCRRASRRRTRARRDRRRAEAAEAAGSSGGGGGGGGGGGV